MYATFTDTKKGTRAYIQKSVRVNGAPKTLTLKSLGLLSDIQKEHGCEDPRQWAIDYAAKLTREEKEGNQTVSVDFKPGEVDFGEHPLKKAGDLFLLPLYNGLGLPGICKGIMKGRREKYDLNEILRTLVTSRLLFPASKARTFEKAKDMVKAPGFGEQDMYRSLSVLSEHINDIQAQVYRNSRGIMERRTRVIYYDCSNYYFEIEDNDRDYVDMETGEVVMGLRKRGKSKENRPNPIVQMGLFMDMDGIPLAFVIFPGNESEQTSLKPLEELLDSKFGLTDFIVSTDAGLGSEDNRRYNMAEGRDYICVQSLPSLSEADRAMAVDPKGWRIAWCNDAGRLAALEREYSDDGIFNLDLLLNAEDTDVRKLLADITFYKEIIVIKEKKVDNPEWIRMEKENPGKKHKGTDGKSVPKQITLKRPERVIVTYDNDFALYLRHKRVERLKISDKIVKSKQKKPRQSQQSPLKYVKTVHLTDTGDTAVKVEMSIDDDAISQEERLDGFYAYGTSLEDDAVDVLRARSFHHEIEHIFRSTKTFTEARPVYLSRQDRIRSHFMICFLAMLILKMLQRQLTEANSEAYRENPLTIDYLVEAIRSFQFGQLPDHSYTPMFTRTLLTDRLQDLVGVRLNNRLTSSKMMNAAYRKVNKS